MTTVAGIHQGIDTHANRPTATAVTAGTLYSCSDHSLIYISDGSTWSTYATLGGTDSAAIHDDVAGEIAALTLVTAASGDHVLIEDADDTNNKKRVAASDFLGGGGGIAFSGCTLGRTGTLAVSTQTETVVGWDSELIDTDGYHDNSTNNSRITIPADGTYQFGGGLIFNSSPGVSDLYLKLNGSTYQFQTGFSVNSITTISPPVELTTGDYLTLAVWLNSGQTLAANTRTNFWAKRLA